MNIRNAILHLSQLTSKNKSIEDIILADIPKVHLEQITQIIKRVLIYNHIQATQIQLKQLIIHLIIIYKRQNISYKAWDIKPKSFEIANQCITEINNRLGYDLNRETTKLFLSLLVIILNNMILDLNNYLSKVILNGSLFKWSKILV